MIDITKELMNLHVTLKSLRRYENLTQKQVADKIGITYQSYQAYERGRSLPTLVNFARLCAFFDATPNELLGVD